VKVYTGTGDKGKTSLFSGERISKSNHRIEACGDADELNSVIGALVAALGDVDAQLTRELRQIQADLFAIGAWLATTADSTAAAVLKPLSDAPARRLEKSIDRMDAALDPLKHFILPGGHTTAAWAHIARTVCRRAERRLVALKAAQPDEFQGENYEGALVFLNRLSDYFFVLARYCNKLHNVADTAWEPLESAVNSSQRPMSGEN
jgi:cob(I)alamin adenosyltransferase